MKTLHEDIQEIISDTSRFQKLNEDPALKPEASLQWLLCKLLQKDIFKKIEYDKLYPSGSALACVYMVLLKCTNSPQVSHFQNFCDFLIYKYF